MLAVLDKFSTFFGLRLGYFLFSASKEISKALQSKNTTVQQMLTSVAMLKSFFQRHTNDEHFNRLYKATVELVEEHGINKPVLPQN